MNQPANQQNPEDFSLVLGGALFRLLRRAHLSGDALEQSRRRILLLSAVAWLPPLLLSIFAGRALDDAGGIPFLHDIEAHVRFLIALPLLIGAERHVHLRIRPVVQQFVMRGIVTPADLPRLHAAVDGVTRVRNSVRVELALLVLVYTLGLWASHQQVVPGTTSWFADPEGDRMRLTPAGWWCVLVSLPMFQFLLLRWLLRFLLWLWFLLRVTKLDLHLLPTHADRTAGLAFLSSSISAFVPLLVAQGALLSGLIASRIFFADQNLMSFKLQIAGFLAVLVAGVLSPLLIFTPHLARVKNRGLREIGELASRYSSSFQGKWLHGVAPPEGELLGSGDVQSLADMGSCHAIVQEMRTVPFGWQDVVRVAAVTALPLLPLLLTVFSLEDVVVQLFRVIL